jgi:hypothetical protein
MRWSLRGRKWRYAKKVDGGATAFPIIQTVLESTQPIGTETVEEVTSPFPHKLQLPNESLQDTQPLVTCQIKTDALLGNETTKKKEKKMSNKLTTTVSDDIYFAIDDSRKADETFNDAVRRILARALKISTKK